MYFAWDNNAWQPVDEEAIEEVRMCGYEVIKRESPPSTPPYEYKHDLYEDELVMGEVERGFNLLTKYLAAF